MYIFEFTCVLFCFVLGFGFGFGENVLFPRFGNLDDLLLHN